MSIRIKAIITIVLASLLIIVFSVLAGTGYVRGVIAPLPESPFRDIGRALIVAGLVAFFLSVIAAAIASSFIKKAFEEIAAHREAAEAASTFKSNFLANMSNEIRSPMNVILNAAETIMRDESISPQVKEGLGKIYHSGDLLLNIINDILDLSKIEAGKLEPVLSEYKFAGLINDIVTLNIIRGEDKPIEFKLFASENVPAALFGDELRIKQILSNLLSNAFKYTEKGVVTLSVTTQIEKESDESEVMLVFRVKDTGQGMTEEQVNKLFSEYIPLNSEASRTAEGTGLGMSITHHLVQMMNGDISVKSELNQGTEFTVRLPQKRIGTGVLGEDLFKTLQDFELDNTKNANRAQVTYEPMPYGHVLLVDDAQTNLYVADGLMTPYGLKVDIAMSGLEAIEKIDGGKVYDIIFMDHMMPKMDGIEATKRLREMGYNHPIVALTANAAAGQADVFLRNGFDRFMSKPIDIHDLNTVLKMYVRDKHPLDVIEAARRHKSATGVKAVREAGKPAVNPRLAEIFVSDAIKAIAGIETARQKSGAYDSNGLRTYTVNAHMLKSALANIGETELSKDAARLEQAGRDQDIAVIAKETDVFLGKLRRVLEKLAPQKREDGGSVVLEADYDALREKLLIIKEACGIYDKKTAKEAIVDLRQKSWPPQTRELLGVIDGHLLGGDYEEVIRILGEMLEDGEK